VVTVQAGDTFARLGEHAFTIAPEAGGAGYLELIETLPRLGLLPDRILHTWLLTWERSFRPGSTFFHRNQEYGFYSLFHLAQALGKAGDEDADDSLDRGRQRQPAACNESRCPAPTRRRRSAPAR
jgi:hypothetical protein